jgi:hypothetical protein
MTGNRQPVDLVRALLSFSSILLLLVMVVLPSGNSTPSSISDKRSANSSESPIINGYTQDHSLDLHYSWQRELLNDQAWEGDPFIVIVSAILPRMADGKAYSAHAAGQNDGLGCTVRLQAKISGGYSDAQGRYKYCHWSFGDGSVLKDQTALIDDTLEVSHLYAGSALLHKRYTAKVLVVDTAGAVAWGASLPIVMQ